MRTILFMVQKEFIQIFRDKFMLRLIFAMPIIQLLVLANTATYEIDNIRVYMLDSDKSTLSARLANTIEGSPYFIMAGAGTDLNTAMLAVQKEEADLILRVPDQFAYDLARGTPTQVQVLVNAINGTKAGLAQAYLGQLIARFNREITVDTQTETGDPARMGIHIDHRNWYNPFEDYKIFMVPGILVALVTLLAMFLSALNIVREKELGTIEQLNVTTIGKFQFILGKLIPFGILAILVLAIGLVVARFVFHVPIEGSLALLFAYAILYIVTAMGLGIFISNISSSQQQAMFTSFFFMMIFILMSGLFTPIESMPEWAITITKANPLSYFIEFMRLVLLKGSTFFEVKGLFAAMGIYALVSNTLALATYRKTAV